MENTSKVQSRRGRGLKFDQEWKDAVDRLPKHYRDEICAAIEAYQRDLTVIEVSEGVPRAIFMLIMPTIRRRYRARELRRLARDRKAASQSRRQEAEQRPSIVRNISAQPSPAMQPKPAVQSDPVMVVKQPESASPAPATVPSGRQPAPVADSPLRWPSLRLPQSMSLPPANRAKARLKSSSPTGRAAATAIAAATNQERWNSEGDMPVRCLKYLPNDDWLVKLSS